MDYAGEQTRTNLPSNTKVMKHETFNPLLVLMMLMYPTVLGFALVARLAAFALVIPTPTVPCGAPPVAGAPMSSSSFYAGKPADLWDTGGAGARVRTGFAFASIAFVHIFLFVYLIEGPPGASFVKTHRNGRAWIFTASVGFWLVTTCFLLTYTSIARYGAHDWEWIVAGFTSCMILAITLLLQYPLCRANFDA